MNELITEHEFSDGNSIIVFFSYVTWEFYRQSTVTDIEKISFQEVIREIDTCPDKSAAWKQEKIMKFSRLIGLQSEVA